MLTLGRVLLHDPDDDQSPEPPFSNHVDVSVCLRACGKIVDALTGEKPEKPAKSKKKRAA